MTGGNIYVGNLGSQERCPKCGGTLFLYQDHNGWYEQCLQCGFVCYLRVVAKEGKELVFAPLKKVEFDSHDN